MPISIIVAHDKNRLIGQNGQIPWRIKEDLQFFRSITIPSTVIMGRCTWDSLPKRPLSKRTNVVLTRERDYSDARYGCMLPDKRIAGYFDEKEMCIKFHDLLDAITWIRFLEEIHDIPNLPIFIIGGERIYGEALDLGIVDKIYLTEVKGEFEGDRYFPRLRQKWKKALLYSCDEFDRYILTK